MVYENNRQMKSSRGGRIFVAMVCVLVGVAFAAASIADNREKVQHVATAPAADIGLRPSPLQTQMPSETDRLRNEVANLERQLDNAIARRVRVQARVQQRNATIIELRQQVTDLTPPPPPPPVLSLADKDAIWFAAYTEAGGRNPDVFRTIILPCESGTGPNAHEAIGPTNDHGRAQVNRPVWETTFERLFGVEFAGNILDPRLNGLMAAHIEQVQGLSAWVCYNTRR